MRSTSDCPRIYRALGFRRRRPRPIFVSLQAIDRVLYRLDSSYTGASRSLIGASTMMFRRPVIMTGTDGPIRVVPSVEQAPGIGSGAATVSQTVCSYGLNLAMSTVTAPSLSSGSTARLILLSLSHSAASSATPYEQFEHIPHSFMRGVYTAVRTPTFHTVAVI
jgi:hypothetical protein